MLETDSVSCDSCGRLYFDDFWQDYFDAIDPYEDDDDNLVGETIFDAGQMVCCDKILADCVCDQPIDFDDVYNLQLEDLYETGTGYGSSLKGLNDSLCEQCVHYQQPSCLPLRAWFKRYMTDGHGSFSKISMCSLVELRDTEVAIPLGPTRTKEPSPFLNHVHNQFCSQNYCNDEYDEQDLVDLSSASNGHPDLLLGYHP